MGYDLGVDLGTTFVAAAVSRERRVEMFTLGNRSVVAPAVVYRSAASELLFGEAADRQAFSHPDRVEREIKRRLGDPTPIVLGGVPYQVSMLMGAMLRDVITRVTAVEGAPPDRVALTHPANWGPYRRELFEEVPQLAGLSGSYMFTEPEAAAAHYATSRYLGDGDTIAVYDLGGGTFDATVLRKHRDGIELLGEPDGIERLGGIDFDEAILQWINYDQGGVLAELDLDDPQAAAALAKLRQDCVLAKEALSADTDTRIPVLLPGRHFEVQLTRGQFEDMIRAQIESTIGTLTRALRSAQVDVEQLSAVLLVGGSSRIPLISRMIQEELNRPTVVDAHPKHAVALGAARVASTRPMPDPWMRSDSGGRTEPTIAIEPAAPGGRRAGEDPYPAPALPGAGVAAANDPAGRPAGRPAATAGGDGGSGWSGGGGPGPSAARPPSGERPPALVSSAMTGMVSAPARPKDQNRARTPLIVGAAAGLVLLVALAAGVVLSRRHDDSPDAVRAAATSPTSPASAGPSSTSSDETTASATPPPLTTPAAAISVPSPDKPIKLAYAPEYVVASPSGRELYVANANAKNVTVLSTVADSVIATVPVPTGPPRFLAFSPDGRFVYVSIWDDEGGKIAAVSVLDTRDNHIVSTTKVSTRPFLGAVSHDGTQLWVPNHDSGTVSIMDTATNKVTGSFPVPKNPHWVAFSRDGRFAYTANHESDLISVIDYSTHKVVKTIPVGDSPHSLAVNPRRPMLMNVNYGSGDVSVINTTKRAIVEKSIPVKTNPQNIQWSPDGRFAYAVNNGSNSVSVISADSLKVTATIPVGRFPTSITVLPDGTKAYVSNENSNSLSVLQLSEN